MAVEKNKNLITKMFPEIQPFLGDSGEIKNLQYWREKQLNFVYLIFSLFGLVAYIPSTYAAAGQGFWNLVILNTLIYGSVLFFHFYKTFSFLVKTLFLIVACYLIGISLLFTIDADYSINWFFSAPIFAAVLLGLQAAIVTLGVTTLMMTVAGFSIHAGYANWTNSESNLMQGWALLSVSAIVLNAVTAISISIVFEQLKRTLDKLISANMNLDAERETLIYEIRQRITAEAEKEVINRKLQQSQKMEAIGMMAGGVAHDLNNILSGVINYPELILMKLPADSEFRKPLEAVIRSGNRAADVVADLLTVARGVASTKQSCCLNSIVDEYLESPEASSLRTRYPQITIEKQLDKNIENIFCSRTHIFKSLMNLVINSAESIEGKGNILIRTAGNVFHNSSEGDELVQGEFSTLEVRDSGTGIAEYDIKRIFEPFYTRKVMGVSGTGLGLTIVWNTVQEHNGHVDVTSDAISGTCFSMSFPVCSDDFEETKLSESPVDLKGSGEIILVVDDEEEQREIASSILRSLNYNVVTASSGEAAIEFLNRSRADLVVLDMLMPPNMNGLEAYKKFAEICPGQKAVIVSGFSESNDVKEALAAGVSEFLAKPYAGEQLALAVKRTLNLPA